MADDPEQLRIFGLQENQHVIATIFNPNSSLHRNLEYLEETAEDACSQAREAFGETDPIYLDAELNASLFYLYRTRNYVSANAHLTAARSIVGSSSGTPDTLLAKLLFTLTINERRRTAGESRSSPITDV